MTFKALIVVTIVLLILLGILAVQGRAEGSEVHKAMPVNDDPDGKRSFHDVPETAWYYNDVMYVAKHGILVGTPDGFFLPKDAMTTSMTICAFGRIEGMDPKYRATSHCVTRQTFAVIAYWYLTEYLGAEMHESDIRFQDDHEIAGFAKQAVYSLRWAGIIYGDENSNFRPDDYITRAEAASILHELCMWVEKTNE